MNFVYYIVRKKDNVILDGAEDVVSAINMAKKENCACFILQACIITEIGQDLDESSLKDMMPQEDVENVDDIEDILESEIVTEAIE